MNTTFIEEIEMEIDYDLVEKIGATHYDKANNFLLKIEPFHDPQFWCDSGDRFHSYQPTALHIAEHIKPIPPKPQVRFEYEKVKLSNVGEFVQEVHDDYGKYYFLNKCSGEYQVAEFQDAAYYWKDDNVYRRVEKVVDWRDEVESFIDKAEHGGGLCDIDFNYKDKSLSDNDFLEMCRVALRATGELK